MIETFKMSKFEKTQKEKGQHMNVLMVVRLNQLLKKKASNAYLQRS